MLVMNCNADLFSDLTSPRAIVIDGLNKFAVNSNGSGLRVDVGFTALFLSFG